MSKLQQHYKETFDQVRRYSPKKVKYRNLSKDFALTHKPNKQLIKYAKYMNCTLNTCASANSNIKLGLNKKDVLLLELITIINNIPCIITFSNNKLCDISMGGDMRKPEIEMYSYTEQNHKVLNSTVTVIKTIPYFRNIYRPYNSKQNRDIENTLNDIISTYDCTIPMTEEQEFQISTVLDNAQYYLPVYQRACHIIKSIKAVKESTGNNPSALQLIRFSVGL